MVENLGYLRAKLEDIHDDVKEIKSKVNEQNGRVRKLEYFKYWMLGGLGVIGIVVSFILSKIYA